MHLYCAVDIRGGRCVRLLRGDYDAETVYSNDPVAQARSLQRQGANWIHVVDLDGARSGRASNTDVVAEIATAVDVPVQAGGGIRDIATAERWFEAGVKRVVIGTAALRDPLLVRQLAVTHDVAVGLDARSGEIATDGWRKASGVTVFDVARRFADDGVKAFVVTDIDRDGTLGGPDVAGLRRVLDTTSVEVIASGGVGTVDDLERLARLRGEHGQGLGGVIVGKALYEGRFSVAEGVAALTVGGQ